MCGICGILNRDAAPVDERELRAMAETMRHRGPDEGGIWLKGRAGLGVRRLSVIDVQGGHQPVANEAGTMFAALNGEIYNYRELTRELRGKGHRFRTRGDTEVLVHLYEEYGEGMLEKVNGMFALAIWDGEKERLFLARDRMGQKPLYYWQGGGRTAFASEMKALLKLKDFRPELQPNAVLDYLTFGYVPHPASMLKDVSKLPPAHMATIKNGNISVRRYWHPVGEKVSLARGEAEERLRELMTDAVRLRLESEVPLGAFLSGGIDSSIVVGLMAGLSREPVRTFTIGFDEKRYDERGWAGLVAEKFGTKHVSEEVRPDAVKIFEKLVWHLDEPLADSSAVPTFALSELARKSVTVALSGDGGDECFLGYPRHSAVWLSGRLDRLPAFVRRLLFGRIRRLMPAGAEQKSLRHRWNRFARAMDKNPLMRFLEWISVFDPESCRGLLTDDFRSSLLTESGRYHVELSDYPSRMDSDVAKAAAFDMEFYLPCDLMAKVDRMSMAHGLEVRSPFLDHRVVEFAMGLPDSFKMKKGRGKQILRSAFAGILPDAVRKRGKMGFAAPVGRWLREDLREMAQGLLSGMLVGRSIIRADAVEALLAEHQSGQNDHGQRLWALLVLEKWLSLFLG